MRVSLLLVFSLGTALLASPSPARAHHNHPESPHVYATGWGITLASDGSGFYNDFARFALGKDLAHDNYVVSPYKRAMREFRDDKNGCLYPKSIDVLIRTKDWNEGDTFIESDAMMHSPMRVFSAPEKRVVRTDTDLKGMRLAFALGSRATKSLAGRGLEFVPVADEVDKAKLLDAGLVDLMLANMPDAQFVFESLGRPLPAYDPNYDPMPIPRIRVVCHDTPMTREFIKTLNTRLKMLKTSGQMRDFLTGSGLDPEKYLP